MVAFICMRLQSSFCLSHLALRLSCKKSLLMLKKWFDWLHHIKWTIRQALSLCLNTWMILLHLKIRLRSHQLSMKIWLKIQLLSICLFSSMWVLRTWFLSMIMSNTLNLFCNRTSNLNSSISWWIFMVACLTFCLKMPQAIRSTLWWGYQASQMKRSPFINWQIMPLSIKKLHQVPLKHLSSSISSKLES